MSATTARYTAARSNLAPRCWLTLALLTACFVGAPIALADAVPTDVGASHGHSARQAASIADHRAGWPAWDHVVRVVTLRDYNTRIVLTGTFLLGVVAGVVGTFTLLRRRALVGDVVSHAALPGIAIAFLVAQVIAPQSGRSLPGLLLGALVAGLVAMVCVLAIRRTTRLKEDAALAIVLSVFFGLGIALFTVVQNIPAGNIAGLQGFIFGKAASMVAGDVELISIAAVVVLLVCGLVFKELSLLCFDEDFAAAQGWPVTKLDLLLLGLVATVTVIGLQSVGLLLVVAMLIIPPVAARFWTDRLGRMTVLAALIGGSSAAGGVLLSALFPRLATGAVIVLVGFAFFVVSMLLGLRHGVIRRAWQRGRLRRHVDREHLLRAFYECLEAPDTAAASSAADAMAQQRVSFARLLAHRAWTPRRLRRLLRAAAGERLVRAEADGSYVLTAAGLAGARRVARNHRLWELYLIAHADVAPSRVDRYADLIEHVVEPEIIAGLEALLARQYPHLSDVPPSPHALDRPLAAAH